MKFLNTNSHAVYVDDPSDETRDLTRIYPAQTVDADGRFADNLSVTPGIIPANSEEAKAFRKGEKGEDGEIKYDVNDPVVLAVGPDLERPEPSESDRAAEAYGQKLAARDEAGMIGMTKAELQDLADAKGVQFAKKDTKQDLIEKIEASEVGGTITSDQVPAA